MRKVKKDLVSKKQPISQKKVENSKQAKVEDLASKAKNLPKNIKNEVQKMEINHNLQKVKPKKK
jgi:hypothetical protein